MKLTKEIKIALVSIVGLVVLFFGLQFLKGLSVFERDSSYYVAFDDATGLSESAPVYANGYRVGVVKHLDYDYRPDGKIVATLGLHKEMRVPAGSHAELASDLLGNIKINLVLSQDPLHMLAVGDTISGSAELSLMSKVGNMVPAIEAMLPKLDSIMCSLNRLLADPALPHVLHNVEGMTANLDATSRDLRSLSASLNRSVPSLMVKADSTLGHTQQLTSHLAQIDVAQMAASVNQTLANVEQLTNRLNSNEGTLGLLMRDPSLYNHLSATAADADALLIDLKENPWRYVHFSLFGSKK